MNIGGGGGQRSTVPHCLYESFLAQNLPVIGKFYTKFEHRYSDFYKKDKYIQNKIGHLQLLLCFHEKSFIKRNPSFLQEIYFDLQILKFKLEKIDIFRFFLETFHRKFEFVLIELDSCVSDTFRHALYVPCPICAFAVAFMCMCHAIICAMPYMCHTLYVPCTICAMHYNMCNALPYVGNAQATLYMS